MRIKITVAYLGKNYVGWQKQPNGLQSVSQTIEDAFFKLTGERIAVHGSGRTDGGVHANGQVAHFDTNCTIPPKRMPVAMNTHLPLDIRVLNSKEVSKEFHSRYNAKNKAYIYKIYNSLTASPFHTDTHAHVKPCLDIVAMRQAADYIIGKHDFTCFMATGSVIKNTIREVYDLTVSRRGKEVIIKISGNGFLYNMVRIIAGTLIDVGIHKIAPENLIDIIASKDRLKSGKTMPPEGLYLHSVKYI